MPDEPNLEEQLDSFDPLARSAALRELAARGAGDLPPPGDNVNLHIHSFFSFNERGYSPPHIACEARRAGLLAAGICDFDVLDGVEEFHEAGRILGLPTTGNIETRAFLREFAQAEINSPGEPGVTYVMGAGFVAKPAAGSEADAVLAGYRHRARARNEALVKRINARLADVALDYERDALPLTPAGTATERHIVRAYLNRSRAVFPEPDRRLAFWAGVLGISAAEAERLSADTAALEERVRARLVKRGGLGYEPPSPTTFPAVDDFMAWVASCGAIPMMTWLDGTSEGERAPSRMIECMMAKGAAALNIIPDRNWRISDPRTREIKTAKLREIVEAAGRFRLPINIGTEMNRSGQPFCDDLTAEALRPYREAFQRGAHIFVGHSRLLRYADISYVGREAAAEFGADTAAKNAFFESVGRLAPVTEALDQRLTDMGTAKARAALRDSARKGRWAGL